MILYPPPTLGYNVVLDDPGTVYLDNKEVSQHGRFYDPTASKSRALPEPYRVTSDQGNSNIELDEAAVDYVALANGQDLDKVHYVLRRDSGIVNSGYADYTAQLVNERLQFSWPSAARPKFEYVVFGGAIVFVKKIVDDKYYIYMAEVGMPLPTSVLYPPVQRFRSIDQFDVLATLPYNAVMFCKKGDACWLPKNRLRPLNVAPQVFAELNLAVAEKK